MVEIRPFILLNLAAAFCNPFCHGTKERTQVQSGQVTVGRADRGAVSASNSYGDIYIRHSSSYETRRPGFVRSIPITRMSAVARQCAHRSIHISLLLRQLDVKASTWFPTRAQL